MHKRKIPFKKALIWIFVSTLIVSGSTTGAILYYSHLKELQENDERYTVVALVQSGPDKGVLKTEYLAELMELSVDTPQNLYQFDLDLAKQRLLASPLIKKVELKKVRPGTVYVNYQVRKPIAFVGDYSNTAVDEEGVFIPFKPFFSPKILPTLILGNGADCSWGNRFEGERAAFALSLLNDALSLPISSQVEVLDFSQAELPSYGQRQIVLQLESANPKQTRLLRLSKKNLSQQIANYLVLENELSKGNFNSETLVIDLRIPKLAFLGR